MKKLSLIIVFTLIIGVFAVTPVFAADQYIEAAGYAFCTVEKPQGGGNKDIMVIQDGYVPVVGDGGNVQYDTVDFVPEPHEVAFGYTFDKAYTVKQVEFTEGGHFGDGGWYADGKIRVQALVGDKWVDVESTTVTPEYPVSDNQADFGDPYETFTFTFTPIECTGIQVIGTTGGAIYFTSCAELKVVAEVAQLENLVTAQMRIQAEKEARMKDLIAKGYIEGICTPIVLVTEPAGGGSKDLAVINDGIIPEPDATNYGTVQYDTVNESHPDANKWFPHEEWIGYEFPETYIISALEFTEGGNFFDGGWWFEGNVGVQVLQNGNWVDIKSKVSPDYPTGDSQEEFLPNFETFTFTFDPVECDGVRLFGEAGGTAYFISCSELRVKIDPSQLAAIQAEAPEAVAPVAANTDAGDTAPAADTAVAATVSQAPETSDMGIILLALAAVSVITFISCQKTKKRRA